MTQSIFVLLVGMKAMTRYYFDVRDDHCLALDDEGVELSNVDAVQEEAARSLADIARDAVLNLRGCAKVRDLVIEVRDEDGPLLQAKFSFDVTRMH